jgi:hypothetical protein
MNSEADVGATSLLHPGMSLRRGGDRRQTRIGDGRNRYAALHVGRLEPGQNIAASI